MPREVANATRDESTRSTPQYTRTPRECGAAIPGTARTRAAPNSVRKRTMACANSFGRSRKEGPLPRPRTSAGVSRGAWSADDRTATGARTGSRGSSTSAAPSGSPDRGGIGIPPAGSAGPKKLPPRENATGPGGGGGRGGARPPPRRGGGPLRVHEQDVRRPEVHAPGRPAADAAHRAPREDFEHARRNRLGP